MKLERVVFVHPFLLHYHYPRLHALAEECRKEGISFTNIELAGYIEIYRTLFKSRAKTFDNVTLFEGRDLGSVQFARIWSALKKTLEGLKPDVVLTYGYSLRIMRRVMFWAKKNHVAIGLMSDSNAFDTKRHRAIEFFKSLFVSRYEAGFVGGTSSRLYLQQLGIPAERIVPGLDVVDNEFFRQKIQANRADLAGVRRKWGLPENSFLFVGRLVPNKNIRGLLAAYGRYAECMDSRTPWGLVICGSGPQDSELRDIVREMPARLDQLIQFRGQVGQSDLPDFFSGTSCLVLPSTSLESWGLVVNEAMACGLPVLVSNKCGCAEDLVRNGVNGWQFDPHDLDSLARLMRILHDMDFQKREEMGRHGEKIISEWGPGKFSLNGLTAARIAFRDKLDPGDKQVVSSENEA